MGANPDEVTMNRTDTAESIDDLRAEIERTRSEMTETVNAIRVKLDPQRLKGEARMAAREATLGRAENMVSNARITAEGAGQTMFETIKQNPVPAALTALGIGWLMVESRSSASARRRQRYPARREREYGYYDARDLETEAEAYYPREGGREKMAGMQEQAGSMREGAEDLGHRAQDMAGEMRREAGEMGQRAQDTVGEAMDEVGRMGDEARDRMEDFSQQAEYQMRRTSSWLEHTMQERPLMIGAIALATGAAIGLAVPESRREDEWMGEARESLVHRTQDAADQAMEKAQHVAEEATGAMQEEMEEQGLSDRVKHAAEETAHGAQEVAEKGKQAAEDEARKQGM